MSYRKGRSVDLQPNIIQLLFSYYLIIILLFNSTIIFLSTTVEYLRRHEGYGRNERGSKSQGLRAGDLPGSCS